MPVFLYEKSINTTWNNCVILPIIVLLPIIILLLKKKPQFILIFTVIYPLIRLPFFILFDYEIGNLNISIEALGILAVLSLTLSNEIRIRFDLYFPIFILLVTSSLLGLILAYATIPTTVIFLGLKLLLLPFLVASVARFDEVLKSKLIISILYIQILNCLAAIVETVLGVSRLQNFGLQYGTNIRNFDSYLRAPGLSLTNYELGSFSSITLVIVYLLLTDQLNMIKKISRKLQFFSGISSLLCLALSNFRSGMVFSIVAIIFIELLARRKITSSSLFIILGTIFVLIAILGNFFLLDSNSFIERQDRWSELLSNYDWVIGSGIGFSGAASLSSYAPIGSAIITDNQFITLLLQFGLAGFFFLMAIFFYLFYKGNAISKSLIIALMIMMCFGEVWDLTVFFSICLYLIFNGIISKHKLIHS